MRVIAGDFEGTKGPARTFTPVNVWTNNQAEGGMRRSLSSLPEGHTSMLVVLSGHITVGGDAGGGGAPGWSCCRAKAAVSAVAPGGDDLVLTGEPIDEPIVGYGPFVMNSEDEIRAAIDDFNSGRFGQIAHARGERRPARRMAASAPASDRAPLICNQGVLVGAVASVRFVPAVAGAGVDD